MGPADDGGLKSPFSQSTIHSHTDYHTDTHTYTTLRQTKTHTERNVKRHCLPLSFFSVYDSHAQQSYIHLRCQPSSLLLRKKLSSTSSLTEPKGFPQFWLPQLWVLLAPFLSFSLSPSSTPPPPPLPRSWLCVCQLVFP
eukprot:RCo010836